MNSLENYIYEKYIKNRLVEEGGKKLFYMSDLSSLDLDDKQKEFIKILLNKKNITLIKNKFDNEHKLREFIENIIIPINICKIKNSQDDSKYITLSDIKDYNLSEEEFYYVMNYLNNQDIIVRGEDSTYDGEFENYQYRLNHKQKNLPSKNMSKEELNNLVIEYKKTKDKKILNEIVRNTMRLVNHITYDYVKKTNCNIDDLRSYGYEGLLRGIENFDSSTGNYITTYLTKCIRGYILRGIAEVSVDVKSQFYFDYIKAKKDLLEKENIDISDGSKYLDKIVNLLVSKGKISDNKLSIEGVKRRIQYIELGNFDVDNEDELKKYIEDGQLYDYTNLENNLYYEQLRKTLEEAIDTLRYRERLVINYRFGLDGGEPMTLDAIGNLFNLSKDRIRQIESQALRKLRKPEIKKKLKDYLEDDCLYVETSSRKI